MENLRNRTDVKLVHSPEKLRKFVAKPSLDRIRIFNEDLVGLQHKKIKLKLDRPIYIGACILELAKLAMYEFHYDYMKPKYSDAVELLYTDTDRYDQHTQTHTHTHTSVLFYQGKNQLINNCTLLLVFKNLIKGN